LTRFDGRVRQINARDSAPRFSAAPRTFGDEIDVVSISSNLYEQKTCAFNRFPRQNFKDLRTLSFQTEANITLHDVRRT
jgi:hypothetical protein